jgi:hypothetical protein
MPHCGFLVSFVRLKDVVDHSKWQGEVLSKVHVTLPGSRHSTGGSSFHLLEIEVRGILPECTRPCTGEFIETIVPAKPAHGDEACVHQRLASLILRSAKSERSGLSLVRLHFVIGKGKAEARERASIGEARVLELRLRSAVIEDPVEDVLPPSFENCTPLPFTLAV